MNLTLCNHRDEETEAQGHKATCPKVRRQVQARPGGKLPSSSSYSPQGVFPIKALESRSLQPLKGPGNAMPADKGRPCSILVAMLLTGRPLS